MFQKIYCLPDIVNDTTRPEIIKVLEQLYANNSKSAKMELLQLSNDKIQIYSARYSQKGRMLFTLITDNGTRYITILELLDNHEYERAKCLNITNISPLLAKQLDISDFPVLHSDPNKIDDLNFNFTTVEKLHYVGNTPFVFSNEQNEIQLLKLPAVISGPAGSGKTLSAVYIAQEAIRELRLRNSSAQSSNSPGYGKILLLGANDEGIAKLKDMLQKELAEGEVLETFCDFATPSTLINYVKEINGKPPTLIQAAQSQFITQQFNKHKLDKTKLLPLLRLALEGSIQDYQSKNLTKEQLKNMQTLLLDPYLKHCKDKAWLDMDVMPFDLKTSYIKIIADECQNLSPNIILSLTRGAQGEQGEQGEQAFFFMDTQQTTKVQGDCSTLARLKQKKSRFNYHNLGTQTHRCKPMIVNVANAVLRISNFLEGGIKEKDNYTAITVNEQSADPGKVYWQKSIDKPLELSA